MIQNEEIEKNHGRFEEVLQEVEFQMREPEEGGGCELKWTASVLLATRK